MKPLMNKIIQGDCLEILPTLPHATMIFADPPDNLGLAYDGFKDKRPVEAYHADLHDWLETATDLASIVWFSVYYKYLLSVHFQAHGCGASRLFLWRFTFGQHRHTDCGNGYRPIIRIMRPGAILYPDAIRVESARQKQGDKRADPRGRVPDDVWEFPRVVGNAKERRPWHPTQHPEALIERIVKFSTRPGDLVIDLFAGSGTANRVCKRLNRACIGIELSPTYCKKIRAEL